MAEKKRVDLVKIDVFTEDFEWLSINMKFQVEETVKALGGFLVPLGKDPEGGADFFKALKKIGHPTLTKEDLVAFCTQMPLEELEHLTKNVNEVLERRKKGTQE